MPSVMVLMQNTNYGSATELQSIAVAAVNDGYIRESYLKFDCALGITVRR